MTTITMEASRERVDETRGALAAPFTVEMLPTLASAEPLWRAFERDAVASPYQRFDWVNAFVGATGIAADMRVVVIKDTAGITAALLPFHLVRRFGLRVATAPGGKHANYTLPLMTAAFARSCNPGQGATCLREIGRLLGADAVAIGNVPTSWEGHASPFAALGRPSADQAFRLDLHGSGDAALERAMSKDARKKLRAKERGLAKLGEVALIEARRPDDIERVLDAFFAQKQKRFRELGIADPFAGTWARGFVRSAAVGGLAEGTPAVELYALSVDRTIVATFGGAADERRLSGMFISFDGDTEAARFSPGDVLVARIVRQQSERGRLTFDLGVGDARYKRSICDSVDPLVDVTVSVTLRGAAYAATSILLADAKRRAKADPRVMRLVARLRGIKATFIH